MHSVMGGIHFKGETGYGYEILSTVPSSRIDQGASKLFTGSHQWSSRKETKNHSSGGRWWLRSQLVYGRVVGRGAG